MFIQITRRVRYKGGLTVEPGQTFVDAKLTPADHPGLTPAGFSVPHPNFTDPLIRLYVPSTHAVETTCPTCGDTADWCPEAR